MSVYFHFYEEFVTLVHRANLPNQAWPSADLPDPEDPQQACAIECWVGYYLTRKNLNTEVYFRWNQGIQRKEDPGKEG